MHASCADYVVRPLFVTLADVAPALGAHCLRLIDRNKASWTELAEGRKAA
jgi:hypothetical protein